MFVKTRAILTHNNCQKDVRGKTASGDVYGRTYTYAPAQVRGYFINGKPVRPGCKAYKRAFPYWKALTELALQTWGKV